MPVDTMPPDDVRTPGTPAVILITPALIEGDLPSVAGGQFQVSERTARTWEQELLTSLGSSGEVPAAALLFPEDAGDAAAHVVMADPVAFTPGRDEAALTPPEALAIQPDERDALFAAANELLADDGILFVAGVDGRNYLTGFDPDGLDTLPTHALAGRNIGHHLPAGEKGGGWRRLMTEVQMIWHAHPVNEARERTGQVPVNGVWFWGGADPSLIAPTSTACTVVSDDVLAQALAKQAGADVCSVDAQRAVEKATLSGGQLIIIDLSAYEAWLANDSDALATARAVMLDRWLQPLASTVLDGRSDSFEVCCGDGRFIAYEATARPSMLQDLAGRLRTWWVSGRRP